MREKIVIAGIKNADPTQPPSSTADPSPVSCTDNGVLYVALTDGEGILGVFGSNNDSYNPDPVADNLRTIAFAYHFDPTSNAWVQLHTADNSLDEIPADDQARQSSPVINYQYLWDQSFQVFRRLTGVANNASILASDTVSSLQVAGYNFMSGVDTSNNQLWTRVRALTSDSVGELGQALLTVEQLDSPQHDAPAVHTAATVSVSGSNTAPVKISSIGYSITAVAALPGPVLVELREDTAGANTLIWSTQELVPVGQSKTVLLPVNMMAQIDCTLTVADPGAANFVTASLVTNGSMGNGSP